MVCISFLKRKIYRRSFTYHYNFNTLYYTYIFYGENLDLYSTGFHGLDELPGIRVRAILIAHENTICATIFYKPISMSINISFFIF